MIYINVEYQYLLQISSGKKFVSQGGKYFEIDFLAFRARQTSSVIMQLD